MKQTHKFLPLLIILCSLIGGGIGAYFFQEIALKAPSVEEVKEVAKTQINLIDLQHTITEKVAEVSPSVVSIIVQKEMVIYRSDPWGFFQRPVGNVQRKVWGGTGFFVHKDGTIITNKHVVSEINAEYIVITNDGNEYPARVLALDPINDLAVIKIQSDTEFQALDMIQDTDTIQIGQFGIAIGNALAEFQNSVSLGIVSGKERSIEAGGEKLTGLIQTDAAINPGNSGWPLINLDGKVMGINTAIVFESNGIGFSIGLTKDKVDYMLDSIALYGEIKRPFIGINYIHNSPGVAQELTLDVDYGAYIIDEEKSVLENTSAAAAGLEPGDIILEVNDTKVTPLRELWSFVQNAIPGETLKLKVLKKSGDEKIIDLELWAY